LSTRLLCIVDSRNLPCQLLEINIEDLGMASGESNVQETAVAVFPPSVLRNSSRVTIPVSPLNRAIGTPDSPANSLATETVPDPDSDAQSGRHSPSNAESISTVHSNHTPTELEPGRAREVDFVITGRAPEDHVIAHSVTVSSDLESQEKIPRKFNGPGLGANSLSRPNVFTKSAQFLSKILPKQLSSPGMELPKVAIKAGFPGNWFRFAPHTAAVVVTAALVQLSFRDVYWMEYVLPYVPMLLIS
jgi:hypothetical protein